VADPFNAITWYDDSFAAVSTDFSYTFAMPEADVNLSADFGKARLGTSFDLGKYPQTVVEDSATLAALKTATDSDSDGYLEYGSDEYKKVTGAPYIPTTSPLRATSPSPRGRRITSRSSRSSGGSSPARGRRPAS
jgi:hypothetical protein